MSRKFDKERDPYTFSLGGISTIASFVAPTAIEMDRMNRLRKERLAESNEPQSGPEDQSDPTDAGTLFGRFWLRLARRGS